MLSFLPGVRTEIMPGSAQDNRFLHVHKMLTHTFAADLRFPVCQKSATATIGHQQITQ